MMDQDKPKKSFHHIDGDFYDIYHTLTPEQREVQLKVRAFMEKSKASGK